MLAPIREIFQLLLINFRRRYNISEYCTEEEELVAFRRRCLFRRYIPCKPAKYGIKVFALVGARVFYTRNLEIYAGVQPEGSFKVDNSEVIKQLMNQILENGRNITVENWFTSVPLAEEKKLTLVGTMRKKQKKTATRNGGCNEQEGKQQLVLFQEKYVTCVIRIKEKEERNSVIDDKQPSHYKSKAREIKENPLS